MKISPSPKGIRVRVEINGQNNNKTISFLTDSHLNNENFSTFSIHQLIVSNVVMEKFFLAWTSFYNRQVNWCILSTIESLLRSYFVSKKKIKHYKIKQIERIK